MRKQLQTKMKNFGLLSSQVSFLHTAGGCGNDNKPSVQYRKSTAPSPRQHLAAAGQRTPYFANTLKSLSRAPFSSLTIRASSPVSSQIPSQEEHRSTLMDL